MYGFNVDLSNINNASLVPLEDRHLHTHTKSVQKIFSDITLAPHNDL